MTAPIRRHGVWLQQSRVDEIATASPIALATDSGVKAKRARYDNDGLVIVYVGDPFTPRKAA